MPRDSTLSCPGHLRSKATGLAIGSIGGAATHWHQLSRKFEGTSEPVTQLAEFFSRFHRFSVNCSNTSSDPDTQLLLAYLLSLPLLGRHVCYCPYPYLSSNIILQRRFRSRSLLHQYGIFVDMNSFSRIHGQLPGYCFGRQAEFQRTAPRFTPTAILGAQTEDGRYQSTSEEAVSRCSRLLRLRFLSYEA